MEEKIYKRQVTKLSLSKRVLDAKQIDQHYEFDELAQLYCTEFIETTDVHSNFDELPVDKLLAEILQRSTNLIQKYHIHDHILLESTDQQLTENEKKFAWEEFEDAKKTEKTGKRAKKQSTFPCLDNPPPYPEDNNIFGFSTTELLNLLTLKAQQDTGNSDVVEQIPFLLSKLHDEMAQGITSVNHSVLHIILNT